MKREDYKPLGQYIQLVDERNHDGAINNLVGVSFEKKIIPSIANTIGTDLSNYRVIKPGQFAYCPVTSRNGDRISIALYKGGDNAILSVAYSVFEITKVNELDADYLMLWVSRPEFDRYARFMSHGSVRELFSWEDMCNVLLPVPSIEEQRRIVAEYQTVERRIKNNEALIQKLEETAQAIYHHTFVEGIDENNLPEGWRKVCLSDICVSINSGSTPKVFISDAKLPCINYFKAETISERHEILPNSLSFISTDINETMRRSIIEPEDILFTMAGTIGKFCIVEDEYTPANTNQAICVIRADINIISPNVLYGIFLSGRHDEYCTRNIQEAVQANLSLSNIRNMPFILPNERTFYNYSKKIECIVSYIRNLYKENSYLRTLLSLLTSKLA